MNKPMVIIFTIVVIAILSTGFYTFALRSSRSEVMMDKDQVLKSNDEASQEPVSTILQEDDRVMEAEKMIEDKVVDSQYVQFSTAAFESASNSRRVLFFFASWCPTCKSADESFTQNEGEIPDDVTLIRVNYSDPDTDQEEKDLAKQYGVTYQHTFVQIDSNGREVTKWNGGEFKELRTNIK